MEQRRPRVFQGCSEVDFKLNTMLLDEHLVDDMHSGEKVDFKLKCFFS
jgi:hypothetical protein